jgi:hypothetical protein
MGHQSVLWLHVLSLKSITDDDVNHTSVKVSEDGEVPRNSRWSALAEKMVKVCGLPKSVSRAIGVWLLGTAN